MSSSLPLPPARSLPFGRYSRKQGPQLTVIGEITPHPGLSVLTPAGIEYSPKHKGYNHFSHD